ncbi:MAG: helix-turn-helix domain-containing protein [Bacteroidales bacterium]|nr:helix-turn-helix domain-containing protein [Bacteroidales bacterium]
MLQTIAKKTLRPNHYVFPGVSNKYVPGVQNIVENMLINNKGKPLRVDEGIKFIIEKIFGYKHPELVIKTRKAEIVFPRQVGMVLLLLAKWGVKEAGWFYGKDHATALHARKKRILPLLETKSPYHDYHKLVCALKSFNILYPQYSLSDLPRGWDDTSKRIQKPHSWHREFDSSLPSLQRQ